MQNTLVGDRIIMLVRLLGLDHNPIRRRTDRIEAGATLAAIILVLASLPVAFGIGFAVYQQNMEISTQQYSAREYVAAQLSGPPPTAVTAQGGSTVFLSQAEWTTEDGMVHTGVIQVSSNAGQNSTVDIWTGHDGTQTTAPLTWESALGRGAVAMSVAVGALALLLWAAVAVARWRLNRRRFADWDVEWRNYGPQWTPTA